MPKSIAILAPSSVPFQLGGAEKFWLGLRSALARQEDCWCELIKLPAPENTFAEIVQSYKTFSELDLSHFDLLITSKYPAWMARHRNHICYLLHPLRGLYDCYHFLHLPETIVNAPVALRDLLKLIRKPGPTRADLPLAFELCEQALKCKSLPSSFFAFPGPLIRELVHFFDQIALAPGQIKAYFAISATVAQRPDYLPSAAAATILHPPSDLAGFLCHKGEYFFTVSRLNASKRVKLIIDAMARLPDDIPLKIAGVGPELERLRKLAANDPRIEFLGFVPDDDLPRLYANALAVPFVPLQEDYGLIAYEAFMSGKPVVTTKDAGGVRELVEHGETGLVVEPTPAALGSALAALAKDRQLAARLGARGREKAEKISWRNIAASLLQQGFHEPDRPIILVASFFAADVCGAGGERRLYHFCRQLASQYQVELVCFGSQTQKNVQRQKLAQRFEQTTLPWPALAIHEAQLLAENTNASVDDIAIARHAASDETLCQNLARLGEKAACAIVINPWLFDAIKAALPGLPVLYDAHDVATDLKTAIFGPGRLATETTELEARAVADAKMVFVCSNRDKQRFQEYYQKSARQISVLPNGCAIQPTTEGRATLRSRLPYPKSKLVLFIASGHMPNQEAAQAIFSMAAKTPEAEFLLAGTVATQRAVRMAERPANVHLLGPVSEDVKNILLQAADLAINPVSSGSGTNLKIIEYLASGLQCVSTPFGARGLPDNLAPALVICDLQRFPQMVRQSLQAPADEQILKKIGRELASQFAWSHVFAPLCPMLGRIIGQGNAAAN